MVMDSKDRIITSLRAELRNRTNQLLQLQGTISDLEQTIAILQEQIAQLEDILDDDKHLGN